MSLTSQNSTQNLFFKSDNIKKFSEVLSEVQAEISGKYSSLLVDGTNNNEQKQQIKRYIQKFLLDRKIAVNGFSQAELADKLYSEMAEFSFLTKYIFGEGIEEININSWYDSQLDMVLMPSHTS